MREYQGLKVGDTATFTFTGRVDSLEDPEHNACARIVGYPTSYTHYIFLESADVKVQKVIAPEHGDVFKVTSYGNWMCIRKGGKNLMVSSRGSELSVEVFVEDYGARAEKIATLSGKE